MNIKRTVPAMRYKLLQNGSVGATKDDILTTESGGGYGEFSWNGVTGPSVSHLTYKFNCCILSETSQPRVVEHFQAVKLLTFSV